MGECSLYSILTSLPLIGPILKLLLQLTIKIVKVKCVKKFNIATMEDGFYYNDIPFKDNLKDIKIVHLPKYK